MIRPAKEGAVGGALLVTSAVLVAGAIGYARSHIAEEIPRGRDGCPIEWSRVKGSTVLLADQTDRYSVGQRDELEAIIKQLVERMGQDERLALHVITSRAADSSEPWKPQGWKRGFSYCKPRDGRSANSITENRRFLQKDYDQKFGTPLSAALAELLKGDEAPQSPILEAIEAVMASPALRYGGAPRRLHVHSDFLHHTAGWSLLKGPPPDPCVIASLPVALQLKGVRWDDLTIVLHPMRNAQFANRQGPQLAKWWADLLYLLGAPAIYESDRLLPKPVDGCLAPAVGQGSKPTKSDNPNVRGGKQKPAAAKRAKETRP